MMVWNPSCKGWFYTQQWSAEDRGLQGRTQPKIWGRVLTLN